MNKKDLHPDTAVFVNDAESTVQFRPLSAVRHLSARLAALACIRRLARLYSRLLEEPVSPRRTLRLLHVQLAGLLLVLPADLHPGFRLLFLAWLMLAARSCRSDR